MAILPGRMRVAARLLPFITALLAAHAASGAPVIPEEIADAIFADGEAEFFVILKEQADLSAARRLARKEEKGRYVFETLRAKAESSQRKIRAWLDSRGVEYRPYWIKNMVLVTGDLEVLLDVAEHPDAAEIRPNRPANYIDLVRRGTGDAGDGSLAVEWNLTQIQADRVWDELGVTGSGIVVMGNDTGVQWDHPALKNHYRGWNGAAADHNYNWFDPGGRFPAAPGDNNDHGTHTMGTMVGDDGGGNRIGVAPGAKWIACKGCASNSCSDAHLLACFQFALAPTDLSGANPDPQKAPHVMNNSWGGSGGDDWCYSTIQTLVDAGIYMSFSAGNSGSKCSTHGSPGDYDIVTSTGAVSQGGSIASFSSRGPSKMTPVTPKPNVVAPGVNIRSSVPTNTYESGWNGPSMAAPHTSGLVALLWSADPSLIGDVAQTQGIIEQSAVPTEDGQCSVPAPPNAVYGWGEIDCYAAVQPRTVPTPTPIPTLVPTVTPTPTETPTPTVPPTPVPTLPPAENVLSSSLVTRGEILRGTFVLRESVKRPFRPYVVVVLPDGSMRDARTLGMTLNPLVWFMPALGAPFEYEILRARVPEGAPPGTYALVTAFFDSTIDVQSRWQAFLDVSAFFQVQ